MVCSFEIFTCVTRSPFVQAWISIEKKLIGSISTSNNQVQSFSYAGVIPSGSKEVLIYVTVGTGHNESDTVCEVALTASDYEIKCTKYIMAHVYPQNAWSYNSENMWFPTTADSSIHVKYTGPVLAKYHMQVNVIGYKRHCSCL